ncbi:MAG: hypothetical protein EA401_01900 [Planctomycetota bacterium]|nr:MAG: hypothetical protein EA401_01900 [Planctomycetota bacterium]
MFIMQKTLTVQSLSHDFRHQDWDAVNDSPRQRDFRRLAPMPYGGVLIARDDMDEECIRWHFRTMRELGFNSIKQFMPCDRWSDEQLERLALEEGLVPWWYGEGGWEPITDELCQRLDIDPALPIAEIRQHPRMLDHQRQVLSRRFGWPKLKLNPEMQAGMFAESRKSVAGRLGTNAELAEEFFDLFKQWLRKHYQDDIQALNKAWNCDGSYAGDATSGYASFDDIPYAAAANKREYRRVRDILRFKAEWKNADVLATGVQGAERDPFEPQRSGGEMGLFLPFASRGTDMEGIARAMRDSGSFYPSIHLCWHFEETYFEVAKPVYMQASFVVDLNKGGWTAPWESTGGPQHTSGSKAALFPQVADRQPGYTVHAGTMTQLQLSYLAAGCRGTGIWSWNARMAGVEAGEYALLDRNEQVCERTRRVGAIAKAANRYRDELWAAHKEPQVGILMDWDNEACWAAMSQFGRTVFKQFPMEGRVGASRACIDANVPFEYVTATNLREGLASRYPIIYMPTVLGLSRDLLPILQDYVAGGGRLVMDMPGGCYDETGRVLWTKKGTPFARLFGVELADLHFGGTNATWSIDGDAIHGYTADLVPVGAAVRACYDNGQPAITEHMVGKGSATVLGWEAARACYRPGNQAWQDRLIQALLDGRRPFYAVSGQAVAYRLAAPVADHYFLINQGPATAAHFTHVPHVYGACQDALTGEPVDLAAAIMVEQDGGRWIRCQHASR